MIGERGRILTRPLTREEQKLCEDHHHIIYEVMRRYRFTDPGLDVYGEFALALMDAAQQYTSYIAIKTAVDLYRKERWWGRT